MIGSDRRNPGSGPEGSGCAWGLRDQGAAGIRRLGFSPTTYCRTSHVDRQPLPECLRPRFRAPVGWCAPAAHAFGEEQKGGSCPLWPRRDFGLCPDRARGGLDPARLTTEAPRRCRLYSQWRETVVLQRHPRGLAHRVCKTRPNWSRATRAQLTACGGPTRPA